MSEQPPRYYYFWDAVAKMFVVAGIICGGIAFWKYDRHERIASVVQKQVDARVAQETEGIRRDLARFESNLTEAQAVKEGSLATIAEGEAEVAAAPRIQVKMGYTEGEEFKGVRQFRIQPTIVNIGMPPYELDSVKMEVFAGKPEEFTANILQKTEQLYDLSDQMENLRLRIENSQWNPSIVQTGETERLTSEWEKLLKQYEEMHADCPHGLLFWVSEESGDFAWEVVPNLTRVIDVAVKLQHDEQIELPFVYVLTESFAHLANWHRFVLTVNPGKEHSQSFEIVQPMMRIPKEEGDGVALGTSESGYTRRVYTTSFGPLAPIDTVDGSESEDQDEEQSE